MDKLVEWLKKYGIVVSVLGLLLSAVFSPFGLDALVGAYAFLGAALVFALGALMVWTVSPRYEKRKVLLKGTLLLLVAACAGGLAYLLWWAWQPHFEITAFDTLEGDVNAYELTDQLIWNRNKLQEYGVGITFTVEVLPIYHGKQKFGSVVALVSGDSNNPPLEKLLWGGFTSASDAVKIYLTLPELLDASGLQVNSAPPTNPFRPGDFPFQQARLIVQIVREADPAHPWASEEIIVRNAPWEQRSALVQRNGRRELDIYVRNLGGAGGFTVRYRLARLERDIGTSSLPGVSGATFATSWNEPKALVYLEKGEFFTDTVSIPDQLAQGRYLIEVYAVKKQNYVQFQDPRTRWENLNSMNSPWWFGRYPSDMHIFVVTTPEFDIDYAVQAEWKRLKDGGIFDLGLVTGPVEDVTSASGTVGLRQVFQNGEVYVHDGQAYALYGPILEHYKELGGHEYVRLGFPTSPIQAVVSALGTPGYTMEFEGLPDYHPSVIYNTSRKGTAAIWILISHGRVFDVSAQQSWQDTGVQVQQGDRVTIVQVGGTWALWGFGSEGPRYDANGDADLGPHPQKHTPLPLANTGALIGKIGENLFLVGRWSVLTAPAGGTLYLAMNDDNYEDNDGLITVQIMVED